MGFLDGVLSGTIDKATKNTKALLEGALEQEAKILRDAEDHFFDRANGCSIIVKVDIQFPQIEKATPVTK